MNSRQSQTGRWVEAACMMEVLSPKPGNVSPGRDFADASVRDFMDSACAIAPELAVAGTRPLGVTILKAVQATRAVVNHNTNLGIILLIAPLAAVHEGRTLNDGIDEVLNAAVVSDSRIVYQAIRLAQPGGIGDSTEQDLNSEPTLNLVECMRLASDRDMIARQYANSFEDVLKNGVRWLDEAAEHAESQPQQIAWLALRLMAEFGDSLIARKCGQQMSNTVRLKASEVLDNGWPIGQYSTRRFAEFDAFLRHDSNRRNPGTTADLVAAILFAALREGRMVGAGNWLPEGAHQRVSDS